MFAVVCVKPQFTTASALFSFPHSACGCFFTEFRVLRFQRENVALLNVLFSVGKNDWLASTLCASIKMVQIVLVCLKFCPFCG